MATAYTCRDAVLVPAEREACFAVLRDVGTYARWWTFVRVEALSGVTRLSPGARLRFVATAVGTTVAAVVRVTAVRAPLRLELEYDEGDLRGTAGWELEAVPGGTRVAYVYYRVEPTSAALRAAFDRYDTRLHSLVVREDALAGLVRLFGGPGSDLPDEAWRDHVEARIAAGMPSRA